MKVYKTSRLFYGKYAYKVETKIKGANSFKWRPLEEIRNYCKGLPNSRTLSSRKYTDHDRAELLKYSYQVEPFLDTGLQIRAEWDTLSFYIIDKAKFEEISTSLLPWIKSVTEPASEQEIQSLQEKSSLYYVNELPHSRYKYRIYLRYNMPTHSRLDFLSWLKNYNEKVKPSKGTVRWMSEGTPYFQDPFLYVEDKNTLLMVCLFLGKYARSTQEFAVRDTQNTVK